MTIGRIPNIQGGIQPTILTNKGDLLTATAASTVTNLPVGADGTTLVANSSSSTGVAWAGPAFVAGKNRIINGDFGVWQRGTSFSGFGDNTYTADRFTFYGNGSGYAKTVSQQAFTPGAAPVAGYESANFLRFNQTTAGTSATYNLMLQRVEDVRTLANQTVTLSVWVKADTSRTINFSVNRMYGSGGSGTDYTVVSSSNLSVTTSWQRLTYTFAMPSLSGKTIGAGSYYEVCFNFPNNAVQTFDLWGAQLEAGSIATPFQTATGTLQGELAACQRYYYRCGTIANARFGLGTALSSTQVEIGITFPVTMRTYPATLDYSTLGVWDSVTSTSASAAVFIQSDPSYSTVKLTVASGLTQYRPYYGINFGSSSGYIGFSAEL